MSDEVTQSGLEDRTRGERVAAPSSPEADARVWRIGRLTSGIGIHVEKPMCRVTDCLPIPATGHTLVVNAKATDACLAKIPDDSDEPIFVVRGQDASAVETIAQWRARNPQLSQERDDDVISKIGQFMQWQNAHPDRVKAAD